MSSSALQPVPATPSTGSTTASSPPRRRSSLQGLLVTSVLITVVLMVLTGLVYPLVMTGIAQVLFHDQANGSLIKVNGQVVGSRLIGQSFTKPQYFHPRLSAAGKGYDATSSGGTNLGPTNASLLKNTIAQATAIRKEDGLPPNYPLPSDAVSTSASGLDPDISPAYADLQVARVARARGLSQATVRALVKQHTADRTFGVLGEPRVNVLELNLALDRLKK
ncbi:MAG TPA: potassium-transporting ATPase subunit KdpC [Chloroflexota bacterium]|nr:potassium-transporting ATPase subunit KdpC [Chloroflexota bacterium]